MPRRFDRLRYHVAIDDEVQPGIRARSPGTFRAGVSDTPQAEPPHFNNDEAAARFYLDELLSRDTRPAMRAALDADRPEKVPDLVVHAVQEFPVLGTRLVRFFQDRDEIPVFGSDAIVELDARRHVVAAGAALGDVRGVSSETNIDRKQAIAAISKFTGVSLGLHPNVRAELVFYADDEHEDPDDSWHLAWHLIEVPAAPSEVAESGAGSAYGVIAGHGLGPSPRSMEPRVNYLVDAHTGEILFYYGAGPTFDVPTICFGNDEGGHRQEFWGRRVGDGFEMSDPMRNLKTFDLGLQELSRDSVPDRPISNSEADWVNQATAAVSAHVNAMRVHDFFKSLLQRNGIDDKGMDLVSVVNCTYPRGGEPYPTWNNAVWHERRMWYGQAKRADGSVVSLSQHLDVIAHELTHGVTQFTSRLIYRDEPGALNESFSDLFGVMIKNWYAAANRDDTRTWNWELGSGLAANGGPLRDLSDPARLGLPEHMDQYVTGRADYGGVHTNSSIHNKAAYRVLTMQDEEGGPVFRVTDVAVLYYHTLVRLNSDAIFEDVLRALIDVASTLYAGDERTRTSKVGALEGAYASVGIGQ